MRRFFAFLMLCGAFGLTTIIVGWWAAPAIGGIWGMAVSPRRRPGLIAAGASAMSWLLLLGWTATRGPIQQLADLAGGVLNVPGAVLYLVTIAFAALTAGLAATTTGIVRVMVQR